MPLSKDQVFSYAYLKADMKTKYRENTSWQASVAASQS